MEIRVLTATEAVPYVPALAELLVDAVEGGASVNFVLPLTHAEAVDWWTAALNGDRRVLLAVEDGRVDGCVQVVPAPQPNQAFRADIAKMLVHRRARRRGLGALLLAAAEAEARALGRDLLTLDTQTGGAGERLYLRSGWTRVGEVPGFSTSADGSVREAATFFYKQL